MRIGLEHIDPIIAAAMRERLCAPGKQFLKNNIQWGDPEDFSLVHSFVDRVAKREKKRQPKEDERTAFNVHRRRERMTLNRGFVTAAAPLVIGGAVGMLFTETVGGTQWIGIALGILAWAGGTAAGVYWTRQATSAHELFYELTISEFVSVVPLLTLTPLEAAYCHLLIHVCDRDPNQEGRRAVRRHLIRIKEFIPLGRKLDELRAQNKHSPQMLVRVDEARGEIVDAVLAIEAAVCVILVVPSPAGDAAAEKIETELVRFRAIVEELSAASQAAKPSAKSGRRREQVS